jgi:hypothetical protein
MLKKTRDVVRTVAEQVGIIAPQVNDAQNAAEQRRADLVAAQKAVADGEAALEAADDRSAAPRELAEIEAKLASAKLDAERAQRAYTAAEKRLQASRDVEAGKAKAAAREKRDAALTIRAKAAAEMDRLAVAMAEQTRVYDAQLDALSEVARDGVASQGLRTRGSVLVQFAVQRAGAVESTWFGDRAKQPGAAELAARDEGTILAGA